MWWIDLFFQNVRAIAQRLPRNTMRQHCALAFAGMSRAELLRLRAECYKFAEEITTYICEQDTRDCDIAENTTD